MIIVDKALEARVTQGKPLKVGVIGCGFLGGALAFQILDRVPGMELSAIGTRSPAKALDIFSRSSSTPAVETDSPDQINECIHRGIPCVTSDPLLVCAGVGIDVILDASGSLETGVQIALSCIEHGKHLILINAELDGTVGPLLYARARARGLVFTGTDGDQPGTQMNLLRYVKSMGLKPLVAGNIKGLQDHYRTPETQKSFAAEWGQNPRMTTSFADGTKISFEQALVANATGFRVSQRGMIGMDFKGHVDELTTRYDVESLKSHGGIIDYVVGPQPGPGIYVIALEEDPERQKYLRYFKLGPGPLYSFYTPFHLCHLEAPISAARAALLGDEVVSPSFGPVVDVISMAKRDLKAGEIIDGIGGFCVYGVCENADLTWREGILPIGMSEGCRLLKDIPKDAPILRADVEVPCDSLIHKLRDEQDAHFFGNP